MKRFYLFGFLALMVFDTFAQISFKYTALAVAPLDFDLGWFLRVLKQPWVYGALGGYFGAFVTWMALLRRAPVGPSFAASHLELISVSLCSVWLFHEVLNGYKLVGGLLILLGVCCLAKSEDTDAAARTTRAE